MKALTLTQPWATLVAVGAKKIETRPWGTTYRGPLAIHAAKGFPDWAQDICFEKEFQSALLDARIWATNDLPLGSVVAVCNLVGCWQVLKPGYRYLGPEMEPPVKIPPDGPELDFGNYKPGRFVWILENIKPLDPPVPARGEQRLWDWPYRICVDCGAAVPDDGADCFYCETRPEGV
jgi:hypothetical protein